MHQPTKSRSPKFGDFSRTASTGIASPTAVVGSAAVYPARVSWLEERVGLRRAPTPRTPEPDWRRWFRYRSAVFIPYPACASRSALLTDHQKQSESRKGFAFFEFAITLLASRSRNSSATPAVLVKCPICSADRNTDSLSRVRARGSRHQQRAGSDR